MKVQMRGRLAADEDGGLTVVASAEFRLGPLTFSVEEDVRDLGAYPEIPEMHDRLIVITSNRLSATLSTKDEKIQGAQRVTWLW